MRTNVYIMPPPDEDPNTNSLFRQPFYILGKSDRRRTTSTLHPKTRKPFSGIVLRTGTLLLRATSQHLIEGHQIDITGKPHRNEPLLRAVVGALRVKDIQVACHATAVPRL